MNLNYLTPTPCLKSRYYEFDADSLYLLSEYKSSDPQRGIGFLPRRALNIAECEIARAFKVAGSAIEPIAFIVPRKVSRRVVNSTSRTSLTPCLRRIPSSQIYSLRRRLSNPPSLRPNFSPESLPLRNSSNSTLGRSGRHPPSLRCCSRPRPPASRISPLSLASLVCRAIHVPILKPRSPVSLAPRCPHPSLRHQREPLFQIKKAPQHHRVTTIM